MSTLEEAINRTREQRRPAVALAIDAAQGDSGPTLLRQILDGPSPGLQRRLTESLCRRQRAQQLADVILGSFPPSAGAWSAMAELDDTSLREEQIRMRNDWAERILGLRPDALSPVNALLICRRIPGLKPHLIRQLNPLALRVLSVFVEDSDFEPLIEALSRDGTTIPTVVGLALRPQRLARLYQSQPALADQLAARHGFTVRVPIQAALPLLEAGVWHINRQMLTRPSADVLHDVSRVSGQIMRTRGELQSAMPERDENFTVDVHSEYHRGTLFAAVRSLECHCLDERRSSSIFDFSLHRDIATDAVRLMHVPESVFTASLFDEAMRLSVECRIPNQWVGRFVMEWTATRIESDDGLRAEAELFLRARWCAMATAGEWNPDDFQPDTFGATRRFPAALYCVVPLEGLDRSVPDRPRLRKSPSSQISPCARSIVNLAQVFLTDGEVTKISQRLKESEHRASKLLCPLGVEVQIPSVSDNAHIAWKEVFRSVGIRSERRPECGRMLEASLPPSASAEAVAVFLELLIDLQICSGQQDLAVHVSLQGDCRDDAGYLVLPQLFLNETVHSTPRPRDSMSLVMSKGFVHLNDDVQNCDWAAPADVRTELRIFKGAVRVHDGPALDQKLANAIEQTHLLGSALLAECGARKFPPAGDSRFHAVADKLVRIAAEYRRNLVCWSQSQSEPMQQLLAADFCECTGDYLDTTLLDHMSVLKILSTVQSELQDPDRVRSDLSRIRREAADQVASLVTRSQL